MDQRELGKNVVFIILFILIVNFLANKFYWYSAVWYFDMIMHFLGGFWVGLSAIYFLNIKDFSLKTTFKVFSAVVLIGLSWEIFEIVTDKVVSLNAFNFIDSTSDMFFDLAGGGAALIYVFRRIMGNVIMAKAN